MTRLTLAFILLATPAMACGDACNHPQPEPPTPPSHEVTHATPGTKEQPQQSSALPCCTRDGAVVPLAALGLFRQRIAEICTRAPADAMRRCGRME